MGSKRALKELIGADIAGFAYPFGRPAHYKRQSVRMVEEAGFAYACSNSKGTAHLLASRYELPRLYVPDVGGAEFERLLAPWIPFGASTRLSAAPGRAA